MGVKALENFIKSGVRDGFKDVNVLEEIEIFRK